MPSSATASHHDLYLRLFDPLAGTDPALRRRGTLTEAVESADDDRTVMAGTHSDLPIG